METCTDESEEEEYEYEGEEDDFDEELDYGNATGRRTHRPPANVPPVLVPLSSCSFLAPGLCFTGMQCLQRSRGTSAVSSNAWRVAVRLETVNLVPSGPSGRLAGSLTGVMVALPLASSTNGMVETFFVGEMVDGEGVGWDTRTLARPGSAVDYAHWSQLPGWRATAGEEESYIFMRWKEMHFLNGAAPPVGTGLSIAGFYYVSLRRRDGALTGCALPGSTHSSVADTTGLCYAVYHDLAHEGHPSVQRLTMAPVRRPDAEWPALQEATPRRLSEGPMASAAPLASC